ncbi:hypothetical protein PIB30_059072 [Stylosanthes scabra]|uniref:Uncharacterized protein n=1 Tax=Stylosanthes scabra TaxID=79078 RepID=A0ABU6SL60_9FABA|nr:hypothetical protein [Stylosanthes scabra]
MSKLAFGVRATGATYTATPLPPWRGGNCPREPTLQPLQNTFQNPKAFHLYGSNLPNANGVPALLGVTAQKFPMSMVLQNSLLAQMVSS